MLIHEILEHSAKRLPHKPALIEGDIFLTYAETLSRVRALASSLEDRGVEPGRRVALLFPNCIDFCLAYFAVLSLGGVVGPSEQPAGFPRVSLYRDRLRSRGHDRGRAVLGVVAGLPAGNA